MQRIIFWLKLSRPGLWFPTMWLYLLPIGGLEIQNPVLFWAGLIYVTFPINFMIYGWNDIMDYELDKVNPRKDSFLFGARGSKEELQRAIIPIILCQIPFWGLFIAYGGVKMLGLLVAILITNGLYNLPGDLGLKGRPPFELFNQFAYILIVVMGIWLNNAPWLPWQAFLYMAFFAIQSHIIGEIMDIYADEEGGRRTTAIVLGLRNSKILLIFLVIIETYMLLWIFGDLVLGAALAVFSLWLLVDTFVIYRDRFYSVFEMRLFGITLNVSGFSTMLWVWYSGALHQVI